MAKRTCSIADCQTDAVCRGWCQMHYKRWQKYGDPSRGLMTPVERFWSKVRADGATGCWIWPSLSVSGYGVIGVNGASVYTHRFAYELMVGPIPAGLVIDHLCRNRACCNPAHLEPVTDRVNIQRGDAGKHMRTLMTSERARVMRARVGQR